MVSAHWCGWKEDWVASLRTSLITHRNLNTISPLLRASTYTLIQFSSVAQSCLALCDPMNRSTPGFPVHHQLWESVMPSSHLILGRPLLLLPPIPPASQSFPMSQLFAWGGQSTGVSASASFLPKKSRADLLQNGPVESPCSPRGLSRVFSNTTVQKHQFFNAQLFSQSSSHIHTWPLEKP